MTDIEDKIVIQSPIVYKKLNVSVSSIDLGRSATIYTELLSNLGEVKIETLLLEGNDYTLWGSDDDYIIEYAIQKLGLVRKQ